MLFLLPILFNGQNTAAYWILPPLNGPGAPCGRRLLLRKKGGIIFFLVPTIFRATTKRVASAWLLPISPEVRLKITCAGHWSISSIMVHSLLTSLFFKTAPGSIIYYTADGGIATLPGSKMILRAFFHLKTERYLRK